MLLRPSRVDDSLDLGDLIGGEAALVGVFADQSALGAVYTQ